MHRLCDADPKRSLSIPTDPPLQVLSIALNHPVISSCPRNICSLALVCRAWRQAVQQAGGGNTSIVIKPEASLETIASLAAWMPKHASFISSITATWPLQEDIVGGVPCKTYVNAARQLLQLSLQLAGTATAGAASGSSSIRLFQLRSFSSNYLNTPGILSSLPAACLTQLSIDHQWTDCNAPGVVAALAHLRGLQQLKLHAGYKPLPVTCLSRLAHLTQLTQLDMKITFAEGDVLLEPMPLLQQLRLGIFSEEEFKLDLSLLSRLVDLELWCHDYSCILLQGSALPAQLQRLNLGCCHKFDVASVLNVTSLTQLQQMTLLVTHSDSSALETLACLPQLQQLALLYEAPEPAAATAAAWARLPQLCSLSVDYEEDEAPTPEEFDTIVAGLASTTNLTRLDFGVWVDGIDDEADEIYEGDVFGRLAGLTKLKHLQVISSTSVAKKSAMALTALTGLTSLNLRNAGQAVGDVVATALACNLTGLVSLGLNECDLGYCACLAVIAKLTGLTALDLSRNKVPEEGLMMLTGLTNLQRLGTWQSGLADDVVDRFWAAVRQQQPT